MRIFVGTPTVKNLIRKLPMLNFMRQNANSWIMVTLFSIIIFVFIVNFGPWAGRVSDSTPYAAMVNNEIISMAEFRMLYANQLARIKQFRPDYDETQADQDGLKQLVLDRLVSNTLLAQWGQKSGLVVDANTLAKEIKSRVFGDNEAFSKEEYLRRINAYFYTTPAQFEEQVTKEVIAQQMSDLLQKSINISDEEAKETYKNRFTKIAIEFVKVNPKNFTVSRKISDDEIKKFTTEHGDKIKAYYDENLSKYIKEEEIKASHILIKLTHNASAEEKLKQQKKAEQIRERLNNEDFALVAKAESEDITTKDKGGDLGFFSFGSMVPEFSKAAFVLKPGEISKVVESPFGFHIIKVWETKPKMEQKLEEVSSEIATTLIQKEEADKSAQSIAKLALEQLRQGIPLTKIANLEHNKIIADTTDPFSLSSPFVYKLGSLENIIDLLATLSLSHPTANDIIEANGEILAIRLLSREDADMSKFAEQKSNIVASLLMQRSRAFMQQFINDLKAKSKIKYHEGLNKSSSLG